MIVVVSSLQGKALYWCIEWPMDEISDESRKREQDLDQCRRLGAPKIFFAWPYHPF